MNTPILIGLMAAIAVVLLLAAIVADCKLQQRARKRRLAEESGKPGKRDLADTLIEAMGRTSEAVRHAAKSARQNDTEPKA